MRQMRGRMGSDCRSTASADCCACHRLPLVGLLPLFRHRQCGRHHSRRHLCRQPPCVKLPDGLHHPAVAQHSCYPRLGSPPQPLIQPSSQIPPAEDYPDSPAGIFLLYQKIIVDIVRRLWAEGEGGGEGDGAVGADAEEEIAGFGYKNLSGL